MDGSSRGDAATQVMGGLVGAALHANPRRALVIGLGTGSTAGWLGAVPSIERVDVVELEPAILRVADDCSPVNRDVLKNAKVRVSIGDAREWLLTSRDTYDIIFSEPSNPYRAGVSSLFTRDFYRAVRARLAPGGIFLQWLQAYEVDSETVRTLYATLSSAFPEVETWHTKPNDLLLVATVEPIAHDAAVLRERLRQEPFADAMENGAVGLKGFLLTTLARPSALPARPETPQNTDDRNRVEFGFARSLGSTASSFQCRQPQRVARESARKNPPCRRRTDGGQPVAGDVGDGRGIATLGAAGIERRRARDTAQRSFQEGRPEAVLTNWRAQPWEPQGSVEEVAGFMPPPREPRRRPRQGPRGSRAALCWAEIALARLLAPGAPEALIWSSLRAAGRTRGRCSPSSRTRFRSCSISVPKTPPWRRGWTPPSRSLSRSRFFDDERRLVRLEVAGHWTCHWPRARRARAERALARSVLERRARAYDATGAPARAARRSVRVPRERAAALVPEGPYGG